MPRFTEVNRWSADYNGSFRTYRVRSQGVSIGWARVTTSREVARQLGIRHAWAYSEDGRTWTQLTGYTTRVECGRQLQIIAGQIPNTPAVQPNRRTRRISGQSEGRIFGVEMELLGPRASDIITALNNAGIGMNRRNLQTMQELPYDHTNTQANVWTLKHDGSVLGYGLELVSPKLSGEAGFNAVRTVCRVLNEIGATVDRTCGLHVHHDFRGMDSAQIRPQALMFLDRQDSIMRLVAPSRRNNSYSIPWTTAQIEQLRTNTSTYSIGHIGPRGSLNMYAFGVHGSLEIRAHGGTVNANKIIAWIKFGQAIFAAGAAGADVRFDPEGMLADLEPFGLSSADAAILLRFVTNGEDAGAVALRLEQLRQQVIVVEEQLAELV